MEQVLLVLTTLANQEQAEAFAKSLLEQRLIACANILPSIQSIYTWQGSVQNSSEAMVILKTCQSRYAELEKALAVLHPYELPEIIAVPVKQGLDAYLSWVIKESSGNCDD